MGLSQEKLAELLDVHVATVRRWESGVTEPQPWHRPKLAAALEVSNERLAVLLAEPPHAKSLPASEVLDAVSSTLDGSQHQADDPTTRYWIELNKHQLDALLRLGPGTALRQSASLPSGQPPSPTLMNPLGRGELMHHDKIHPELLAQYETLTDAYRQLDYQAGSGAVYAETVAQLGRMLAMADSVPSPLYQRFARALADTAQLAAWLAIDHQDYGSARHYTALALSSAQEGEDPTMHAYVLGIMSYMHLHAERGPDAIRLLEGALRVAENPRLGVDPAVRSWLCEAMGEAQALAGHRAAGAAFLARAERIFDGVMQAKVPTWLGFFNSPEHVTRLKGRCLVKLGDGPAAVAALDEAISVLPAHYVRERSGTLIDLAAAHLMPTAHSESAADPDAAAHTALDAWQLAVQTGSGRNQRRMQALLSQFTPYRHLPATQELAGALG